MYRQKHVVVIGAGMAGLAASYDLVRAGYRVTLLEESASPGGLAGSINLGGHSMDRFYHFICQPDKELIQLIHEAGLKDQLHWQPSSTAYYYHHRLYPFNGPLDLLSFSAIPWSQRLRFGLHILRSRHQLKWLALDQIPAKQWLIEQIQPKAYDVIWHPLLKVKFGTYYDRISAAWVWHRIWRVANSRHYPWQPETFGYLENGLASLVDRLSSLLQTQPLARLLLNSSARSIEFESGRIAAVQTGRDRFPCDAVLSTVALPVLARLLPALDHPFVQQLRGVDFIGVVCAVLCLKHAFSRYFWMNINDPQICFNGVIELTNLNKHFERRGMHLIYVPYYLPTQDARYGVADDQIIADYAQRLGLLNPEFKKSWIEDWSIQRAPYAQAICTTGFSRLVPAIRSPLRGLYMTDSTQFYPEDRSVSAAIRQGRKAAQLISEDFEREKQQPSLARMAAREVAPQTV